MVWTFYEKVVVSCVIPHFMAFLVLLLVLGFFFFIIYIRGVLWSRDNVEILEFLV